MKRREFLSAAAAGLVLASVKMGRAEQSPPARELIELRVYSFASAAKQKAYEEFLAQAAVPALVQAGMGPVGVFKLLKQDNPDLKTLTVDSTDLYVLLSHKSMDSVLTLSAKLDLDETYQKAGKTILESPKSDPAYLRYESSLMLAFSKIPRVLVPTRAATRILQMRIYESHSAERARTKIHMFNDAGELDIFHRVGMTPVFFGQTLIGAKLPNLTYMLAFDDDKARMAAWDRFMNDPAWKKLKAEPRFKDTVSNITNLVLRPAESSQI